VVVNRSNQTVQGDFANNKSSPDREGHLFNVGNVSLFEPGLSGIAAIEVSAPWVYPGTTTRYQRLLIYNTLDAGHPYALDLFRVKGGKVHDYLMHGSMAFDETAACTLPLQKIDKPYPMLLPNEKWTEPRAMGDTFPLYGAFREVGAGRPRDWWDVVYREAGGNLGTRLIMPGDERTTIYLGRSPAPCRLGFKRERGKEARFYDFWRPALIVRREAAEDLDSLFIVVIEPLQGSSAIKGCRRLPLNRDDPEHVALAVSFVDGREDVVLVDMNAPGITGKPASAEGVVTADGACALKGRIGVLSRKAGSEKKFLIAGTAFSAAGKSLTGAPAFSGTITGAVRPPYAFAGYALVTDAELPEGDTLKGRWMSLTFGAYAVVPGSRGTYPAEIKTQEGITGMFQIERVVRQQGKTYISTADDHGLAIEGGNTVEQMRPLRTFKGLPRFEILLSASQ